MNRDVQNYCGRQGRADDVMVNLNGHEAGNGGYSQGTPKARRAFLGDKFGISSSAWSRRTSARARGCVVRSYVRLGPVNL